MRKRYLAVLFMTVLVLAAACGKKAETDENVPEATPTEAALPTEVPGTEPEVTEQPKPTEEPATEPDTEPTDKPDPTKAPEPEPTDKPEATKVPEIEPTAMPEPTKKPDNTGNTAGMETVVTLGKYKGLRLSKVSKEAIDAELRSVLESYAEEKTVNRAAKAGDIVNINYVGKKDGIAFEGGTDNSADGTDLKLGSGQFIPGFEEGLIGVSAGRVVDLKLTFPAPYPNNPDLSGAEVVFTVTVNAVKEVVYPELTDAFVKEISDSKTVKEYMKNLEENLTRDSYYEQITTLLTANCKIENYPMDKIKAAKEEFTGTYRSYAEYYGSFYGMDTETALKTFFGIASLEYLDRLGEEYAYNVVTNRLVIEKIAETEGIVVSDKLLKEKAAEYAATYGYATAEEFLADYSEEELKNAVLIDEVMDFCIKNAVISVGKHTTI